MTLIASDKISVVVGLGVTGLSIARFLQRNNVRFMLMDSRENPPGLVEFKQRFTDVPLLLGPLDAAVLADASEIIISPGLSLKTPEIAAAIDAGVKVIGDVELFAREVTAPVIAITGSNAKTTVTTLVGEMAIAAGLRTAVGGNIGTPVLDMLDSEIELYVLELSSFQLETTYSLKPKAATILNLTADHMDRYDSLLDYHRAKQRIYFGADNIVVNRDDPLTQAPLAEGVRCWSFGLSAPDRHGFGVVRRQQQSMLAYEFNDLLSVAELKLRGQHNIANVLAALALGYAAELPLESMLDTLKNFQGLPHRCQWVASINNVDYINDSKATNVGATLAALKGFGQSLPNIILIAGGEGKGADFSLLKGELAKHVTLLILIGRDAKQIAAAVDNVVNTVFVESLQDAVTVAKQNAEKGNVVLLSPACASFDMFSGYEDRGNQFIEVVHREVA